MLVANVWIEHPYFKIDRPYSYLADGFTLKQGMRVVVDFNNQRLIGFVDTVFSTDLDQQSYFKQHGFELKMILAVIDEKPLINDELFELGKWLAEQTVSPRIACYQTMLPPKISPKTNQSKIKFIDHVHLEKMDITLSQACINALNALVDNDMIASKWRKNYGTYATSKLIKLKNVSIYKKEARYQADKTYMIEDHLIMTQKQKEAYDTIINNDDEIFLIHGATGSGKTEVYLQLAQKVIDQNKQVLILVPEISLTPQMMIRVKNRFGDQVAIYHSALNDQEKYEQFKRVDENEIAVVVGTRSAAFMPFKKLGLIIMDEEHDTSYKQDKTPCYHCRDVIIKRGEYHGCKIILGSATPALETYARAQKGLYHLIELPDRINEQPLPKTRLVDVKHYLKKGLKEIITPELKDAISKRLKLKQQVILLLNRRGYAPIQQCLNCGYVIKCPDCDIALNFHKDANSLICHTCGRMTRTDQNCPECHKNSWVRLGYGTQRLEEEIASAFPNARILRMDSDTTTKKNAHQKILDKFGSYEADILLGTQMIAKGLDYPKVTLVGILNADSALYRDDFRSAENTFDLLVQASGRSGRGIEVGEVIIQAFDLNHYALQTARRHDYKMFYVYEMQYRHAGNYPPYTYLVSITFGTQKDEVLKRVVTDLAVTLRNDIAIKVLGPTELIKIYKQRRMRIIIKSKNLNYLIKTAKTIVTEFTSLYPDINVMVDVNPLRIE